MTKALKNNKIGGACIDVYSKEPIFAQDAPFIGLENCITTPHLGASTFEAQIEVSKLAGQRIAQALNSKIFIDAVCIEKVRGFRKRRIWKDYKYQNTYENKIPAMKRLDSGKRKSNIR